MIKKKAMRPKSDKSIGLDETKKLPVKKLPVNELPVEVPAEEPVAPIKFLNRYFIPKVRKIIEAPSVSEAIKILNKKD